MSFEPIIKVSELFDIYRNNEVLIFDVSNQKDAKLSYEKEHIFAAYFVDLNSQLSDIQNDISLGGRHPLPKLNAFTKTLKNLGVTKGKHIIIYDNKNGANAAARFWWMLKAVGHEKVQVVDGGFDHLKDFGFELSSGFDAPKIAFEDYKVDKWQLPTMDINEVREFSKREEKFIVDVREKSRYDGVSEPIDFVAGHIPGAINIPFSENLDENGLFKSPAELHEIYSGFFEKTNSENIVIHCGSGVTACHTILALDYAGFEIPNLYVGSWSEWSRNNMPMEISNRII